MCNHRQTLLRRRLDHADVAYPGQPHIQCAGDRRGSQRQHIDLCAQLFEVFLVGDTKALLLVDDHKPQVLKGDILTEQTMGPDENVDFTGSDFRQQTVLFLFGAKA